MEVGASATRRRWPIPSTPGGGGPSPPRPTAVADTCLLLLTVCPSPRARQSLVPAWPPHHSSATGGEPHLLIPGAPDLELTGAVKVLQWRLLLPTRIIGRSEGPVSKTEGGRWPAPTRSRGWRPAHHRAVLAFCLR
ncbi:hypothetical protein BDA96_09G114600 [Sorghum bicolor]|uniref:Uncharacterized protein n=2 Tax=Sorghum bicolor TaxID=4558 RepID=A0A921Q9Q7_SORBI|nr:hypothetical protein BDA96_09G114600 [Sorghum bicolor]OQU77831.1 hypothetical protein SORBI_3009G109450 [Sorghum bicolor]